MAKRKSAKSAKRVKSAKGPGRRKLARKPARRLSEAPKVPAAQGMRPKRADVGYGKPPVEHQFQPGQSGNPAGAPKARTNLWPHFCSFEGMTEAEVRQVQQDKHQPLARRTAAKMALQYWRKGLIGVGLTWSMYVVNRDEGRPTQHVPYDEPAALTPEECDEIRGLMGAKE